LVERLKPAQLATKPVFAAPAPTPQPPRAFGRVTDCCWPLGDPGTRSFRFCGEVSDRGFPYCSAHRSVAYVKRRPDETEAIISRAEQSAA
jgi:GcrA cell cycle regulator